jgi:hypothetical protein
LAAVCHLPDGTYKSNIVREQLWEHSLFAWLIWCSKLTLQPSTSKERGLSACMVLTSLISSFILDFLVSVSLSSHFLT